MLKLPGLLSYLGILPVAFERTQLINYSIYLVFLAYMSSRIFVVRVSFQQFKVTLKGFLKQLKGVCVRISKWTLLQK